MPSRLPSRESGNVLFLILIAVALFAALSFAISYTSRSGNADKDRELKNSLIANSIMEYAASVENSIIRLRTVRACRDTQLSFENSLEGGYVNPSAPAGYACHIFRPEGGNIAAENPPAGSNDGSPWFFANHIALPFVGSMSNNTTGGCSGSDSCVDLVMLLPNLTHEVCLILNSKFKVTPVNPGSGGDIPRESNGPSLLAPADKFQGTYVADGPGIETHIVDGANKGIMSGCDEDSATAGVYYYWHVLLPR